MANASVSLGEGHGYGAVCSPSAPRDGDCNATAPNPSKDYSEEGSTIAGCAVFQRRAMSINLTKGPSARNLRPCQESISPNHDRTLQGVGHFGVASTERDIQGATRLSNLPEDGLGQRLDRVMLGQQPTSLAFTWTAYQPISSVAKVTGSVLATR
jgi:hypothetical protein